MSEMKSCSIVVGWKLKIGTGLCEDLPDYDPLLTMMQKKCSQRVPLYNCQLFYDFLPSQLTTNIFCSVATIMLRVEKISKDFKRMLLVGCLIIL